MEAALRRYGSVSARVGERLDEEFRLIRRHRLAGFLLLYRQFAIEPSATIGARMSFGRVDVAASGANRFLKLPDEVSVSFILC